MKVLDDSKDCAWVVWKSTKISDRFDTPIDRLGLPQAQKPNTRAPPKPKPLQLSIYSNWDAHGSRKAIPSSLNVFGYLGPGYSTSGSNHREAPKLSVFFICGHWAMYVLHTRALIVSGPCVENSWNPSVCPLPELLLW